MNERGLDKAESERRMVLPKKNFNGHGEDRSFGAPTRRHGGRLGEWATGFGPWHLG